MKSIFVILMSTYIAIFNVDAKGCKNWKICYKQELTEGKSMRQEVEISRLDELNSTIIRQANKIKQLEETVNNQTKYIENLLKITETSSGLLFLFIL